MQPDVSAMGELEFLFLLRGLLARDGQQPRVVTVQQWDLCIDIVLPPSMAG